MRADRAEGDSKGGEWESSVAGHVEGRGTSHVQRAAALASREQKGNPSERQGERKAAA